MLVPESECAAGTVPISGSDPVCSYKLLLLLGPHTWHEIFPDALGPRQSPIDVVTSAVTSDTSLRSRPLAWRYVPDNCKAIANPGYCWRLDVNGEGSELVGGPLQATYKLEQFHAHWGPTSDKGSEHTVDGKCYAGELHLVHWNCDKYKTFGEAAGHPDGLAVLGVFLDAGPTDHPELEKIVSLIPSITHKGQTVTVSTPIDPTKLLPENTHYWTYLGSLTTPPCTESVTWILFKEPIQISERQLKVFRSIKRISPEERCNADEENIVINFRPPLPLGNRELRECGQI
ncbi:Phospholipase A2 crotoxin acid subunit CA [Homalodisca vitripennis]|nr:Phospholipase A2 crotoxin acid subunit CA [Homalodisca vitripennis]